MYIPASQCWTLVEYLTLRVFAMCWHIYIPHTVSCDKIFVIASVGLFYLKLWRLFKGTFLVLLFFTLLCLTKVINCIIQIKTIRINIRIAETLIYLLCINYLFSGGSCGVWTRKMYYRMHSSSSRQVLPPVWYVFLWGKTVHKWRIFPTKHL